MTDISRVGWSRCLSVCVCVTDTDVATERRKAALQSVVALLPDENREALYCLLLFLNRLADYAAQNQVSCPQFAHHSAIRASCFYVNCHLSCDN